MSNEWYLPTSMDSLLSSNKRRKHSKQYEDVKWLKKISHSSQQEFNARSKKDKFQICFLELYIIPGFCLMNNDVYFYLKRGKMQQEVRKTER